MKYPTLLTALLFSLKLFGQNWSPISIGEKFNYRHPDSILSSHTIWIDSVSVEGLDSIFYLNKMLHKCPQCPAIGGVRPLLRNRGQFLQKAMRKKAGGLYVLEGERTYTLLTNAGTGASWVFDTAANTTANILSTQLETVFGVSDSVKTIVLSDGLSFKLSRSFGLLSFPEEDADDVLELVGIEGRNAGEVLPTYRQIFDFQPGDVFQYKQRSAEGALTIQSKVKYTILTREETADYLRYQFIRNEEKSVSHFGQLAGVYINNNVGVVTYAADTLIWLNAYPYQYFKTQEVLGKDVYGPVRYTDLPLVGPTKIIGSRATFDGIYSGNLVPFSDLQSDTMVRVTGFYSLEHRFSVGLGETIFDQSFNGGYKYREMIGFIKNGITTGTIYPDFTTATDDPAAEAQAARLHLSGNPAGVALNVDIDMPVAEQGVLQLVNMQGQVLYQITVIPSERHKSIPTTAFSPGIYFLRFQSGHYSDTQKVIIQP